LLLRAQSGSLNEGDPLIQTIRLAQLREGCEFTHSVSAKSTAPMEQKRMMEFITGAPGEAFRKHITQCQCSPIPGIGQSRVFTIFCARPASANRAEHSDPRAGRKLPAHQLPRRLRRGTCGCECERQAQQARAADCFEGPPMEANMDRFIRRQNVERYRRLLERVTEESDRLTITNLFAEERQKQKEAGNPV
jgi:hypothetical protein